MELSDRIELAIKVALVSEAGNLFDALAEAGNDSGLSVKEVAAKAGFETDYVHALAWGKHDGYVPMAHLYKLAEALGRELTIRYLLSEKETPIIKGEAYEIPALDRLLAPEKGLTLADLEYAALKNGQSLFLSFDEVSPSA